MHTQAGNNNPYNQDNETSWLNWNLLEKNRDGALVLSQALQNAVQGIGQCERCRMLTDTPVCSICNSARRDAGLICVVESPADVYAVENATGFSGRYFVLLGHLSPLDGIGPDELGMHQLEQRFQEGEVKEVIIATNPTVEGEATAHFLAEMARAHGIRATRIAHGVPVGGELEYIDGGTLSHAFSGRQEMR